MAVLDVSDPVLPRVPEIAGTVIVFGDPPTFLDEVRGSQGGVIRLASSDEDLIQQREDIRRGFVAAPRRITRVIGQEIARVVEDVVGPDLRKQTVDAQRMESLGKADDPWLEGRLPLEVPQLGRGEIQAIDETVAVGVGEVRI